MYLRTILETSTLLHKQHKLTPFLLSQQYKLSTYPPGIDQVKTIKKLAANHNNDDDDDDGDDDDDDDDDDDGDDDDDDDDDDGNKNDSGGQLAYETECYSLNNNIYTTTLFSH